MGQVKVLCVDDDASVARLLAEVAEFCGHSALVETDPIDATTKHLMVQSVRAVLTDLMMPRLNGIEMLAIWQERRPDVRRVLVTAAPAEAEVREAVRSGLVQMVIAKPPSIADLKVALAWL